MRDPPGAGPPVGARLPPKGHPPVSAHLATRFCAILPHPGPSHPGSCPPWRLLPWPVGARPCGRHAATSAAAPTAAEPRRTARLTVLPPIAQVGPAPAPSRAARTALVAELGPAATAGRPLVVERRSHGHWRSVEHARLRPNGRAGSPSRPGSTGSGCATASPPRVARPAATRTQRRSWSTAWGAPGFLDEFAGTALSGAWEHRIQFHNPWGGRSC